MKTSLLLFPQVHPLRGKDLEEIRYQVVNVVDKYFFSLN